MQRNSDLAAFEAAGIFLPEDSIVVDERPAAWNMDYRKFAMDAQPQLVTTANAGIPAYLATVVDPNWLTVITAKNKAAEIYGEVRKGSFVDLAVTFPVVEHTGEVSSYGDFSNNGTTGLNTNFPQRQPYNYQTMVYYGDEQLERAGLAKLDWASKQRMSATIVLNKFQNLTYFYGVAGLKNYGILNDPSLPVPIAPAPKAAGGVSWFTNGAPNATANEVYNDIVALFSRLQVQSSGNIEKTDRLTLAMSPASAVALTFTNSFNVNVEDLLKKNFPKLEVKTAVQYGVQTSQNPQGSAGGEIVQMIAPEVDGQETGFCAFNEKLRVGRLIPDVSSFKQKYAQGTLGAVIRQPFAIAQGIGY